MFEEFSKKNVEDQFVGGELKINLSMYQMRVKFKVQFGELN